MRRCAEGTEVVSKDDTMQMRESEGALLEAGVSADPAEERPTQIEQEHAGQQAAALPVSENGSLPAGQHELLILIPAYNEAGRVGAVVADVRQTLPQADVLVIDDGSEDATSAEAAQAGAVVLTLPTNCGYGTALQTGYKYAVRHGYARVGQIDADGQHKAEFLSAMLAILDEDAADVVVGSRFLAKDGHYETPFARSLGI